MNAIWYGIQDVSEAFFTVLPPIGALINWFFGLSITVGVIFWLWYDASAQKGGKNFMANKG